MSVSLNHLSIAVHNSFYPLSNTPATSLVDQLPPGHRADCLLLSGCDVRKILYTLYSEQDNGNLSNWDILTVKDLRESMTLLAARRSLPYLVIAFTRDILTVSARHSASLSSA